MIDEVIDVFGWNRKHAIKALNGKVTNGNKAKKRGSKPTHGEEKRHHRAYMEAQRATLWSSPQGNTAVVDEQLRATTSSGEVRVGLERIEKHIPFPMLGFDCYNGCEFLNEL
jgi:hypothetical protein